MFILLGMIVGTMHLWAFVIYGICVAGYECSMFWERITIERHLRVTQLKIPLMAAISFLVPFCGVMSLSPVTSGYKQTIWGLSAWGAPGFWGSLVKWKAEVLASSIYTHQTFIEKPLFITLLLIFLFALTTRTITVNSRMRIVLAIFAVILIAMPNEFAGFWFTDYHFTSGFAFIVLASVAWRQASRVKIETVRLLLAISLIVRVGSVISTWRPAQSIIGEYDTALKLVPPGSRLLVLIGPTRGALFHVPVLAAAKQGVFVPYTWTGEGGLGWTGVYMLKVMPDYRDYLRDSPTTPSSITDIDKYDYLLEVDKPETTIPKSISLN